MVRKIKNIIRKTIFTFIKPEYKIEYRKNSYSQAGEDAIINFLIWDKQIKNLSYLDIGTNNPDLGNNTYALYQRGVRGVCVEADPSLIPKIQAVRSEDTILNLGVNVDIEKNKTADLYIFDEKELNTFDKEEALHREKQGTFKIVKVEQISLININEIIKTHFEEYPTFLSIDIEGLDLGVLKSLDFEKYPIPIICAETCTYSETHIRPKDEKIIEYMTSIGYIVYADTYINTIFVNKEWFHKIERK